MPQRICSPPVGLYGSSMGRMALVSRIWAPWMFSPRVLPLTVGTSRSSSPALASSACTAGMPPAAYRSGMWVGPAGARWHRLGVLAEISLKTFRSMGQPASWAMASRCSTVLVEQPRAMSQVRALRRLRSLMIWRAVTPRRTRSMIAMPERLASCSRLAYTAGMVPLPGRAMPTASHRQFMELAVYIPEQEPQPGQQFSVHSSSCSSEIMPAL